MSNKTFTKEQVLAILSTLVLDNASLSDEAQDALMDAMERALEAHKPMTVIS